MISSLPVTNSLFTDLSGSFRTGRKVRLKLFNKDFIVLSLNFRLAGMEDEAEGDEDELIPYDSDGSLLSEENEDNEGLNAGAESPRSAALRAMGIHAVALQVLRG